MRPVVFTWPAVDADAICVLQTLGAAGALTINGVLLEPAGTTWGAFAAVQPGIERTVTGHSAGNIATVTFTITGKNLRGETVTDTITGINASTVIGASATKFTTITSITADAAVASAVEFGTGEAGNTNSFICDYFAQTFNIGWVADITGTVDFDLQYTADDVQNNSAPVWFDIDNSVTADTAGVFTTPCRAIRAVTGGTNTGSYTLTLIQTG